VAPYAPPDNYKSTPAEEEIIRMTKTWKLAGTFLALGMLTSTAHAKDLGDILLKKGLITEEELKQAREEDKQKSAADESRRDAIMAKLPKWLEMITPFGDIRMRYEGFFQEHRIAENRERLRARIGLTANVSDEVSGTFRIATGDPNNPVTRNQTFNNTFTQKNINLDQAYITLKPSHTLGLEPGWFTLTGGKFSANAYRVSELVWDDDLTPEGATETVTLVEQREGPLRSLKINAFQWEVDEVANDFDPWMGGGQIVSETALGSVASLTTAFADYHYSNMNSAARKFLSPTTSSGAPNGSKNNQLATTNCLLVARDSTGKLTGINGFCSGFNLVNGSVDLDFPDILGIPAGVFGDVVYNTVAPTRNTGFYVGVGIGRSGKDYYHDTLKNQGDWGLSYTYVQVERQATVALFTYDDAAYTQGNTSFQTGVSGGTNIVGHIVKLDYMPITNLQLTWKTHVINAFDSKLDQSTAVVNFRGNPTLVRMQVDAMLKF
jgi:putative porin